MRDEEQARLVVKAAMVVLYMIALGIGWEGVSRLG